MQSLANLRRALPLASLHDGETDDVAFAVALEEDLHGRDAEEEVVDLRGEERRRRLSLRPSHQHAVLERDCNSDLLGQPILADVIVENLRGQLDLFEI